MMTPFSFQGALHLPPDSGLPPAYIPLTAHGHFASTAEFELALYGTGTFTVPLGTLGPAGLKGLLVKVDPSSDPTAAPVIVTTNGAAKGIEIAPGGLFAVASPLPRQGITALVITHTSNIVVRVWALG
jgi:hypothetical protein